jgi:hypothetical protein
LLTEGNQPLVTTPRCTRTLTKARYYVALLYLGDHVVGVRNSARSCQLCKSAMPAGHRGCQTKNEVRLGNLEEKVFGPALPEVTSTHQMLISLAG